VIAVDTHVLVRYLTNDDAEQARRAVALLGGENGVFVAKTVLLETEWVLRTVYALSNEAIRKALLHVCGLPNVAVEDERAITHALEAYAQGLDFADALHCASAPDVEAFYTFDEKFVRQGAKLGLAVKQVPSI